MHNQLIQLFRQARNLEAIKYTQDMVISQLKRTSNSLGISRKFREEPQTPTWDFTSRAKALLILGMLIGAGIAWLAYNPIWDLVDPIHRGESGGYYFGKGPRDTTAEVLFLCLGIVAIVMLLTLVVGRIYYGISMKEKERKANAEYERKANEHNQNEHRRVSRELVVKNEIMRQIDTVQNRRDQVAAALTRLYSENGIHKDYQGLVPVSRICKYLEVGKCFTLTGHEGAYVLYDYERRLDLIRTDLQVIIKKLDDIQKFQEELYTVLSDANNTLKRIERANTRMLSSMESIQENTELNAFNTKAAVEISKATGEFIVMSELLRK